MPTVLIVDDTAVDRRLAGGLLENSPNLDVCYAQNGTEALLQIGNRLPDLVVTDLQMPDIDGLQLVTQINEKYPEVPVVLMTAHGSENIAAQALASGAASYVPKSDLAESLVETVQHILAISETDSRYRKLMGSATRTEMEFQLDNDIAVIQPLVDMIQQIVTSQKLLDPTSRVRACVAIESALHNAMVRGNLEMSRAEFPVASPKLVQERAASEPFSNRKVVCSFRVTPEKLEVSVRDQGPGFDLGQIPDSNDPESFRDGHGRGLVLIRAFMDQVEFDDGGREIRMIKFRNELPNKPR